MLVVYGGARQERSRSFDDRVAAEIWMAQHADYLSDPDGHRFL